ncbi:MAG: DUF2521 family protein [Sporolactobacillus sp.]
MSVVIDFQAKKSSKQMIFEKRALRDISVKKIELSIDDHFSDLLLAVYPDSSVAKDMAAEYALEAYLCGAAAAPNGLHGDNKAAVRHRCERMLERCCDDFYSFWRFWLYDFAVSDTLEQTCRHYLDNWWEEGYDNVLKRLKLRL